MKDIVFFICESVTGMEITVAAGSGPNQVIKRFHLDLPGVGDLSTSGHLDLCIIQDDNTRHINTQYFIVSENGLIASNRLGIRLYHIPELGTVDDGSYLTKFGLGPEMLQDIVALHTRRRSPTPHSGSKEDGLRIPSSSTWTSPGVFPWS